MQIIQSEWERGNAVGCVAVLVNGTKANKSATCKMLNERSRCGRQDNIIPKRNGEVYFAYFFVTGCEIL